ncbi:MAG: UDP-N-acetylmuramate dehydrogenase [Candidatus Aminicenantes bacterium]|nr:UDP-N-acetylmuramate dehydrogenase [Candidatus Aminicenantes bacterium]
MSDIRRLIEEKVGRPLETGVDLKNLSNFKIGGPADYYFAAATLDELRTVVSIAINARFRYYTIGGGFNLLFDDAGFRGLIIRNMCRGLDFEPDSFRLTALGGTPLSDLTSFCRDRGLGGMEFLAGIPGTVGGAVFGNAGAFGRSIGELLTETVLMNSSGVERRGVPPGDLEFGYRDSRLKRTREIVLSADFRPIPGEKSAVASCMDAYLALRAERHPARDMAYAGSYFKNPLGPDGKRTAAGKLLEQVGAKQLTVGGAAVYHGHGNFIFNRGDATAADIRQLAAILKARVKDRFGVGLEEEVIFLPAEPAGV